MICILLKSIAVVMMYVVGGSQVPGCVKKEVEYTLILQRPALAYTHSLSLRTMALTKERTEHKGEFGECATAVLAPATQHPVSLPTPMEPLQ